VSRGPAPLEAAVAGFERRYLLWGLPLCLSCLLAVAWHWSRPGPWNPGLPFNQAVGVLTVAALLLNIPAFLLQRRDLRAQLRTGRPIGAWRFALRFYLISLGLAIALSVLLWQPLLLLLFFYRLYPIVFWLLPYQALLGFVLGRWLAGQSAIMPR
jgi:hypothetical protein